MEELVRKLNAVFLKTGINNTDTNTTLKGYICKEKDGIVVKYASKIQKLSMKYPIKTLNSFPSETEALRIMLKQENIFLKEDVANANEAILELINSKRVDGYTFICKDDESEFIFKWSGHMLYNDTVHVSNEAICNIAEITKIIDKEGEVAFIRV